MGAEKILFGSNGLDWARYLEQFHALGLRDDTVEQILSTNARRVFGLETRSAAGAAGATAGAPG